MTRIFDCNYIVYIVTRTIPHKSTLMCVDSQFYKCYKKYGKPYYRNFSTWWIIKTNHIAFLGMMSEKTLEYVLIHRKFIEMTHLNPKRKKYYYTQLILGMKYDENIIKRFNKEIDVDLKLKCINILRKFTFPSICNPPISLRPHMFGSRSSITR